MRYNLNFELKDREVPASGKSHAKMLDLLAFKYNLTSVDYESLTAWSYVSGDFLKICKRKNNQL